MLKYFFGILYLKITANARKLTQAHFSANFADKIGLQFHFLKKKCCNLYIFVFIKLNILKNSFMKPLKSGDKYDRYSIRILSKKGF